MASFTVFTENSFLEHANVYVYVIGLAYRNLNGQFVELNARKPRVLGLCHGSQEGAGFQI